MGKSGIPPTELQAVLKHELSVLADHAQATFMEGLKRLTAAATNMILEQQAAEQEVAETESQGWGEAAAAPPPPARPLPPAAKRGRLG